MVDLTSNSMFSIRSKLVSLLQPWLLSEPDLDLKLGFLRSHGTATNLRFDTSVLNRLIQHSTCLSFEQVRVQTLSVAVSPCSSSAITVEVAGVYVKLSVRNSVDIPYQSNTDWLENQKKTILSVLDPEGTVLHDVIEKIAVASSSRNWLITSLLNVILRHSRLLIHDLYLELEWCVTDHAVATSLTIKELRLEALHLEPTCLLKGLIRAIFIPPRLCSLALNASMLEIGLKREEQDNCLSFLDSFSICIKLKDLRLLDLDVCVPQLNLAFTPIDLPILQAFDMLTFKVVKCARNGRELWSIARNRIDSLTSSPKLSLLKLVGVIMLWLRYVHAYESLLTLLGYPTEAVFEKCSTRMSLNKKMDANVKNQWKVVSEIEKELSVEILARARRIARERAAVHDQHIENCTQPHLEASSSFLLKVLSILKRTICFIFQSVMHFLFNWVISNQYPEVDETSTIVSGDSYSHYCFNFGQVLIMVYPSNSIHSTINGTSEPPIDISHLKLLLFFVTLDALFLTYTTCSTAQSLYVSCGDLKVKSSLIGSSMGRKLMKGMEHFRRKSNERLIDSKVIVCGEPAPKSLHSEEGVTYSGNSTGNGCFLHLKSCLEELWLNWNKVHQKLEGSNAQNLKNPFLLCEIKSSLMDQDLVRPGAGIWKCNMSMGKLNAELEYTSIVSLALLQRQMQHTLNWAASHGGSAVLSQSPSIKKAEEVEWQYFQKSYAIGMKTAMFSLIPEKKIQIGIVIIGPKIRISLQDGLHSVKKKYVNHNATQPQGDFYIAFNLENIELSVWPTSESSLAASIVESEVDDEGLENDRSIESNFQNIQGKGFVEKIICKGRTGLEFSLMVKCLTAHLEDLEENQQYQLIGLNSAFIHSLSYRKYTYSFTATVIALSTSLSGTTTGAIAFSYMDELEVFLQVVDCVLSALSHASLNPELMSSVYPQEVIWKTEASCGNYSDELTKSSEKGRLLILKSTQFAVDASFEFGSVDIIMNSSRKNHIMDYYRKAYMDSGNDMLSGCDFSEYGIAVSIQNPNAQILFKEGFAKTCIDLSGVQFFVFSCQSQSGEHSVYELRNLIHHSSGCLYVFSLSDLSFTLCGNCHDVVNTFSSGGSTSIPMDDNPVAIPKEFDIQFCDANPTMRSVASNHLHPASVHQLLINIALGEIVMADDSLKNVLIRSHQQKKLLSSLSIGGEHHTISWAIQGGLIILETSALAMFLRCFSAYLLWIQTAFSILGSGVYDSSHRPSESIEHDKKMVNRINSRKELESTSSTLNSGTNDAQYQSKLQLLEALSVSLSQFSLILAISDGSGGVCEFILEADFQLNVELTNLRRKLLFDLRHFSILSQRLLESCPENMNEIRNLHFSPLADNELSSRISSGDVSTGFQSTESVPQGYSDACSSSSPVPQKEYMVENDFSGHSYFIPEDYILKHATASILVEKAVSRQNVGRLSLNIDWIGGGSVSGLDVTVSLSETQMVLSLIESLSDLSEEVTDNSKERYRTRDQEQDNVLEDAIPDGAVVAIQDLQQQTYFAVEGVENQYHVIGTIHYSLVGERALFKVKHCNKRRWGSVVSWFSLISLHAKSGSGEPLRLNYRSGSIFVDISSDSDNSCSLWRTITFRPESYEADNDFESNSQASKNTFFLVNKKCDHGVAFIDGVPEFVKKPGNPFKVKLFPDVSVTHDIFRQDTHLEGTYDPVEEHHTHADEGGSYDPELQHHTNENKDLTFGEASNLPYINITIDKVALTIVHELPDSNYKFPLLQASIDNAQIIVQVLCSKARLIITFTAAILYYDAQGNLWREIVRPVEMCMFYRSRFEFQSSEIVSKRVPVHFFFRIKQVDVYLTELSLDILLFMAGELRMAGPFTVRSSAIFANCCKVENQSSISLSCHFYDNQDATIAGKRSTSVFTRYGALANHPQNPTFLTVQLAAPGDFTTSPIHVSLINARVFAWRTRVIHGSKCSPGPFVVVDVSKKTEDGLSVVVSPLLRIHNETGLSMEICFWRPHEKDAESASVLLRNGDTIDDAMAALDAINLFGGSKKVLMSLTLGNFLFSCRPVTTEYFEILREPISADWSEDLKGVKAVCLSGIFDKLSYEFKRVLGVESAKVSFSTVHCSLNAEGAHISDLYFLVQTIGKDVPIVQPDDFKDAPEGRTLPVALQEQREIFLLPTVKVFNHLQSEIQVLLTETNPDLHSTFGCSTIGKQATIPCGASASFYANPAMIYFSVMLTEFNSSCKAVNSGDWVKKLQKKKNDVNSLDINLDFCSGKYFASLRLSRGDKGILEAVIFTSYVLQNNSDLALLCFASGWKHLSRLEVDEFGSSLPPNVGTFLPPKSTRSWFVKSNRINIRLLEEQTSNALLDLDVVSGFTEVCLETLVGDGVRHISKFGVSLKPLQTKIPLSSQIVLIVPRYVISNETEQNIFVRQCYLEEDIDATIAVDSKQKAALHIKTGSSISREISLFDSLFRKHKHANEDYLIYIQFCLNDIGWSWSGPICVCSLGRFFLKFKRQLDSLGNQSSPVGKPASTLIEFAMVHVEEEGSSLVLSFDRPAKFRPPYRIENLLPNASVTYYQKDSVDPEVLVSGSSVDYVWDDLSLPHRLVVQITDMIPSREINMDKVRGWKPLFKVRQQRGLALELPLDKKPRNQRKTKDESHGLEMLKVGYEVYADGSTRVLRISEFPGRGKEDAVFQLCAKIQFRVTNLVIHLLENKKQEENVNEPSVYNPVVVARLGNINLDSMFTDQNKFNKIRIQSINVDEKWTGAPFAAMFRRNELDYSDMNENILQIVFILLSKDSGVKKVKYASTILQPVQLNIDEETLMKFVPFWRTSLSDSNAPSQQFYFEHFEIHPIKVVASFLPGSSNTSYSSSQETLRSFLHSIVKVPSVTCKNVELNGILLTHALVTVRELFFKCAKHYSWYGMRAVYIAKGSPLLPPGFASIFDDSASSSLDIFFDPSSGLVNLPGMTLGMFKFISKCIDKNGFSGTKRYFGDLGKSVKTAGSNVLFTAVTEISDCVLKGAEANGFNGMVNGFNQGILKLAMEPSVLGTAVMEGGPDRKIVLDRSPGGDELYIEGYLQAMLDTIYKQEYLRVRVIDNQVILKNLPPSSSLINEIIDRVRSFLISKTLLQGESISTSRSLRHLRGEREWKFGPTMLTLWEHLFVSFAIRMLRKHAVKLISNIKLTKNSGVDSVKVIAPAGKEQGIKVNLKWGVQKFVFSGVVAYVDGRLCRCIPNAIVRRIVSGFLLSLLDDSKSE